MDDLGFRLFTIWGGLAAGNYVYAIIAPGPDSADNACNKCYYQAVAMFVVWLVMGHK